MVCDGCLGEKKGTSECERGEKGQGGEGEGGEVGIMCCLRNGEFLHTGQANTNKPY